MNAAKCDIMMIHLSKTFVLFRILRFWIRQNDHWIETKTLVCWDLSQLTSIKFLETNSEKIVKIHFWDWKLDPPPNFLNISSIEGLNTAKWPLNRGENNGISSVITTYVYEIPRKKTVDEIFEIECDPPPHFLNISSIEVLNTSKWPLNQDENDGMLENITTYVYEIPWKKTVKEFFEIECDPPHTFLIFRVLGFWIRQNDCWIKTKTMVCRELSQLTSMKFLGKKQSTNFLKLKLDPPPTLS